MGGDLHEVVNYIEAGLWGLIAVAFMVTGIRRSDQRATCLIAALVFLAFGLSDLVEVRTGAWWRPWWLLAWKALCLAVMLSLWMQHLRRGRRED